MRKINTAYIEIVIAKELGIRENLIVPNVSWGFNIHECDLLCMSKAGYLTEVEIKISLSDLKNDRKKWHGHCDERIKQLYFAIPSKLAKHITYIPEHAGIFVINSKGMVFKIKNPDVNRKAEPLTINERYDLARLGALRIWRLKEKLMNYRGRVK